MHKLSTPRPPAWVPERRRTSSRVEGEEGALGAKQKRVEYIHNGKMCKERDALEEEMEQ